MCEAALNDQVPVSDIMRYLMYHDEYGRQQRAMGLFHDLPAQVRRQLMKVDYAKAEQLCPQKMPIARLMARAMEIFCGDVTRKA